jgi:pimeloyl-ACP methyl ester carboxylesterase
VVVLHGLGQKREHLEPLALKIAGSARDADVFSYGYDHTLHLMTNGDELAKDIRRHIPDGRVDLVGYSMGGLVARLAATVDLAMIPRIRTVVTLATPNRGSISNAELSALGQLGKSLLFISPLSPRSDGIKDLTKAASIMSDRRNYLLKVDPAFRGNATERRYVSIPGLFYHQDRSAYQRAPSLKIAGLHAVVALMSWRVRLLSMPKSNDGIVTERSNDITISESHDWSETRLFDKDASGHPARCHAVVDTCRDHDHISIINDDTVAELIAALLSHDDWRGIRKVQTSLGNRMSIKPIDGP